MATGKITKTAVDAQGAGSFLWDTDIRGFGLKVTSAGAKTYVFQYRMGGRGTPTRRYTIGRHGTLAPEQARAVAKLLAGKVASGIDPVATEQAAAASAVAEAKRANDLAFENMAARFLDEVVKPDWKSSYGYAEGILRLHVTPRLTGTAVDEITREDLIEIVDTLPKGQAALRRNVYSVVRRMFKWMQGRGIERSPLDGYDAAPAPAPSRDRVLTDDELRLAWLAAGKLGKPFADFYRVLIGTGQRREEVASLDWKELHRVAAEWRLPSERSKNNEPHTVPLAPLMFDLFDELAGMAEVDAKDRKWPKRGLVFSTTGKTPISGYSRAKSRLDAEMLKIAREEAEEAGEDVDEVSIDPWRVHDIRRTVATGLQRLGVRFEVTEAVLNHVSGRSRSGIAAVYQRHAWTDEKKAALRAWGTHVEGLLAPAPASNVVPLPTRGNK